MLASAARQLKRRSREAHNIEQQETVMFVLNGLTRRLALSRLALSISGIALFAAPAFANCDGLPGHDALQSALKGSVAASGGPSNGGLDFNMWASIVDRDGLVCAVAFTGAERDDQWPASRVISAQKANTANSLSLDKFALSSGNLYAAVQPGGSLFGLQESNPVDVSVAYRGSAQAFGTGQDPMVGGRIGGINVFGGGLALYSSTGVLGGLGVSGDTSCADHNVAWRVREALGLDAVPNGVNPNHNDGLIYDVPGNGVFSSASGFGHPKCGGKEADIGVSIGAAVE
jgi:uncharacterized protein GlcG (DUF336 family)